MSKDLVVWTGPVADFQVPEANVRGADRYFIGCRGDKGNHPYCPAIGASIESGPEALLQRAGFQGELGDLHFGAFSAGGSIMKRLWTVPAYRDATTSAYLADAMWTANWSDWMDKTPPFDEGFVAFAVDVANGPGDKLLVATTSPHPNREWATGHQNLDANKAEIERRTGRQFQLRSSMPGNIEPPESMEVWQLGNVIFAKYPEEPLGHGHTKIAGDVFQGIIQPWLDKGKGPIDSPDGLPPPGPGPVPPVPPGFPPPAGNRGLTVYWPEVVTMLVAGAAGFAITQIWRQR